MVATSIMLVQLVPRAMPVQWQKVYNLVSWNPSFQQLCDSSSGDRSVDIIYAREHQFAEIWTNIYRYFWESGAVSVQIRPSENRHAMTVNNLFG